MNADEIQEIRALRSEMSDLSQAMASLRSCFTVWQKTRCQDHHDRMDSLETKYGQLELAQTKIIAKAAGATAAIIGVVNILTMALLFYALKDHIGPG